MLLEPQTWFAFAASLGVGLLIGLERERWLGGPRLARGALGPFAAAAAGGALGLTLTG